MPGLSLHPLRLKPPWRPQASSIRTLEGRPGTAETRRGLSVVGSKGPRRTDRQLPAALAVLTKPVRYSGTTERGAFGLISCDAGCILLRRQGLRFA